MSWSPVNVFKSHMAVLFRLRSFDTSTAEGRSLERYRRVTLTALASVGARLVSILTALISIPLTVRYLGAERFGLWVTISSLVALMGFADLGLGNGLVNAISEADARNDRKAARRFVSSAFFMLLGISVVLAIFLGLTYGLVSWSRLFNVTSPEAMAVAGPAMAVFTTCYLAGLPLGVVQRIQIGYQEGFASSMWVAGGNLLGLGGVIFAIYARADLPWLILALAGAPLLASLLNGVVEFSIRRPWLKPRLGDASIRAGKRILQIGLLFFILQVAFAVSYQTDNIVIARILGADQVTMYAVPMRLFMLAPTILSFFFNPLWPAYREALVRGDVEWAAKTLNRSIVAALLVSVPLSGLLVVFGAPILHLWVGHSVTPPILLLVALGIWTVLASVGGGVAMFLNGANALPFQAVCATLMTIANIGLSVTLTRIIGLSGVVWGSVVAVAIFVLIPSAFFVPKLLARLRRDATALEPIQEEVNDDLLVWRAGM